MKKFKLAGVLVALALLLTGCGWQGTGEIVEKTYSAPYDYITFQCYGFDSKGNCTMNLPVTNHIDASYGVRVRGDDDGKIHDVSVYLNYWNAAKVGDRFDNRDKDKK